MPRVDLCVVLVCLLNNKETTWKDNLQKSLPWLNLTEDWEEFKKLPFPKLYLTHHDELHTTAKKIKGKKWINFAIVDEAHKWKARGSRMSRAGAKLSGIKKRLILTGTPIEKQPKDLWGQFRFLCPDLFGSWKEFEDEFMDVRKIDMEGVAPGSARWQIKIMQQGMLRSRAPFRPEKMPKLLEMIKPYCIRLTKEDVGILAPIIQKIQVPLGPYQRRLYDRMKRDSIIKLNGCRSMATMKVTNIIKRREIASGFVFDDDGDYHHIGDAKLDRLIRLFELLPKPIVIFTEFKPENDLIASVLRDMGYSIETLTGKDKKTRAKTQRAFQAAQLDGVVCQSRAGGTGVDLWRANYAIVHSMGYSSITFDQMKSRLDAKHKKKAAKIFVLVASATIDEDLYDLVIDKSLDAKSVLAQLKQGAR